MWTKDGVFTQLAYMDLLGRSFNADSWNCWTLCREMYRRLGKSELPEYPYIADPKDRAAMAGENRSRFARLESPRPWCIIVLAHRVGIVHTGIVLPDCEHFFHVREQCGTVISPIKRWKHQIEGYYDYAGN